MEGDYDYGRLWKITEGWRGDLESYSVTLGGTVHLVDLLLWLTGDRAVRVSATGNRIVTEGTKFRFRRPGGRAPGAGERRRGQGRRELRLRPPALPRTCGCSAPTATFVNGLGDATLWTDRGDGPAAERMDAPYPGVRKGDLIGSFVDAVGGPGRAGRDRRGGVPRDGRLLCDRRARRSSEARVAVEPFG